jgi:uncharacterized protein YvpB
LWYTYYNNGWQTPQDLHAVITGDPRAVSSVTGQADVFWRGQDFRLWTIHCAGGCNAAHEISTVQMGGDPYPVAGDTNQISVFWRGQDSTLWHIEFNGVWDAATSFYYGITSDPAVVSAGPGHVAVFWRGTDNQLREEQYAVNSGWSGPTVLGGAVGDTPVAVRTLLGDVEVVYRGVDNGLWHVSYEGGWSAASELDYGPILGPISATGWYGHPEVFWQNGNGGLRYDSRDFPLTTNYLPTPLIRQSHSLDCEAASLQAALATRGTSVSQDWELGQFGADLRPAAVSNGNVVAWGDAWQTFVGNVNASESNFTGYGVYWPPLQRVATSVGHYAQGGQNWTPNDVYLELSAGHPVVIWINNSYRWQPVRYWTAWDGARVPYSIPGDHTVVLTGINMQNHSVQLLDVGEGVTRTFSMQQFESFWGTFNNMALVVN